MMDAERRYAQIEKEALAITWAREEFSGFPLEHVPGMHLYVTDTLSRAPSLCTEKDLNLEELAGLQMETHIAHLSANKEWLEIYRCAQKCDPTCSPLMRYCHDGWPRKSPVDPVFQLYWECGES